MTMIVNDFFFRFLHLYLLLLLHGYNQLYIICTSTHEKSRILVDAVHVNGSQKETGIGGILLHKS